MDEVIMIGDWIDYGDKIYEVIADKGNDLIFARKFFIKVRTGFSDTENRKS